MLFETQQYSVISDYIFLEIPIPLLLPHCPHYILPKYIKLQIHYRAFLNTTEVGMPVGIGYDGDGKAAFGSVKCGEANSVYADRSFFDDQGAELLWIAETE